MTRSKLVLLLVLTTLLILPPGCRRRSDAFVIALGDNIRTIDPIGSVTGMSAAIAAAIGCSIR